MKGLTTGLGFRLIVADDETQRRLAELIRINMRRTGFLGRSVGIASILLQILDYALKKQNFKSAAAYPKGFKHGTDTLRKFLKTSEFNNAAEAAAKETHLPVPVGNTPWEIEMRDEFIKHAELLNARFAHELWLDFEVVSLQHGSLKIKASTDFCYYHNCEIVFSGVQYFSGPMIWGSNPPEGLIAVLLEPETTQMIKLYGLDPPCNAVELRTDENFKLIVVTAAMHIDFDTVYYYARANLGPNER